MSQTDQGSTNGLHVERLEAGVRIRLPPAGWRQRNRPWWIYAVLGAVPLAFVILGLVTFLQTPPLDWAARAFLALWTSFAALMFGLVVLSIILPWLVAAVRPAVVEYTKDRLVISGTLFRKTGFLEWPRADIQAVVADYLGLWIVTPQMDHRRSIKPHKVRPQLGERPLADLQAIAGLLRDTLKVSSQWPLAPEEQLVWVSTAEKGSEPEGPYESCLFLEGGRLALHHPGKYLPSTRFRRLRGWFWPFHQWLSVSIGGAWFLAPGNCKWTERPDGTRCLIISPTWPADFTLTVWSEEPAKLEAILSRFWEMGP